MDFRVHGLSPASSALLRLIWRWSRLSFGPQFTSGLVRRPAQIVLEPSVDGDLLLFLPPFEDVLPSAAVDIGRRDVSDPFVVAMLDVKLDELRHGRKQSLRAGEHQQIQPSLERLVGPLQLAVGLRMLVRAVSKPEIWFVLAPWRLYLDHGALGNLITLCAPCHASQHGQLYFEKTALESLAKRNSPVE